MNDGKIQVQIATLMYRFRSTINRDLARITGLKRYRPKQALLFAEECSLGSSNVAQINPKDWDKTVACLHKKWNPEQIADQVSQVIITKLNPVTPLVKTLTFHNGKEFA